jgi:cell wall-associated NlpC family hydrolase
VKIAGIFIAVLSFVFGAALLGLVVLVGAANGTAQVASCDLSTTSSTKESTAVVSTASVQDCGAAALATLPSSPIVNDGLPTAYYLPVNATAPETVVITYALAQLGKPYLWGAAGPDAFDCSGLTMMAWAQAGVTLLHYTGDQINEGTPVASFANISPGDLVLVPGSDGTVASPGHVGLYIGDGLVESAVDVQYGVIVQPYSYFVSGGLSGIRYVG